jgi:hypothetical protein
LFLRMIKLEIRAKTVMAEIMAAMGLVFIE